LEDDCGGLKSWEAWNNAIDPAIEDYKVKFAWKNSDM
jgi:hypothetical protein